MCAIFIKLRFSHHALSGCQYQFVFINNIKFSVKSADCYLRSIEGVMKIIKVNNGVKFSCIKIQELFPLFQYPCSSITLGIFYGFEATNIEESIVSRSSIITKYFAVPNNRGSAFYPHYTKLHLSLTDRQGIFLFANFNCMTF